MQPGVTAGALVEYHASRANGGKAPGSNAYPQTTVWRDTSGNGRHATLANFGFTPTSGWAGTGAAADPHRCVADGTDDHWPLPDIGSCEDKTFSVELLYKAAAKSSYNGYMWSEGHTGGTPGNGCSNIRYWNNRLYFVLNDGTTNVQTTGPLTGGDGLYHHTILTCDGISAVWYNDDDAPTSASVAAATGSPSVNMSAVGALAVSGSYGSSGLQKDIVIVRLYPFALTADEAAANIAVGSLWTPTFGILVPDMPAVRSLEIGGLDISDLVEWDSLDRLESEHGDASFTVEIPLEGQWDVLPYQITEDAAVTYRRGGAVGFEGTVARLVREGGSDPLLRLECRGYWAELSDREDYVKGFVNSNRYGRFVQISPDVVDEDPKQELTSASVDLDGQILLSVPIGTAAQAFQTINVGLWVLGGLDRDAQIERVTFDVSCNPGTATAWHGHWMMCADKGEPYESIEMWGSPTEDAYDRDTGYFGTGMRFIVFQFVCDTSTTASAERYVQIRNLRIYIDRTSAPTIPQAVYEAANELGIATSHVTSGSFAALSQLMWDAPATPADHIIETLAKHNAPVLCRIKAGRVMETKPRPGAPDGTSRHFVVSRALQPGMSWGVALDAEAAKEIVCCQYGLEPINELAAVAQVSYTGTTWPTSWTRSTTTNVTIESDGGPYKMRVKSDATERNPWALSTQMPVTAGARYLARCRARLGSYPGSGTAYLSIRWYSDAAGTVQISASTVKSWTTADTTEAWREVVATAPATAVSARWVTIWVGVTGGAAVYSIWARDFDLREATPAETLKRVYYPTGPTANEKVGLVTLEQATAAEALAVAQTAHSLWSAPYEGPVAGLAGTIKTAAGARLPVEEIRAWDWIECLDAPEGERGPHLITQVHETAGGEVDLHAGGDVAFFYEREITRRRGRYIGGRRYRVKVKPATYRWLRNKKGKRVRKLVRKAVYEWRQSEGRYLP